MSDVTIEIKDDSRKIDRILEFANNTIDIEMAIGLFSDTHPEETKKAIINENGSSDGQNPPSRPFVLPTFEANKKGIERKVISGLKRLTDPRIYMQDIAYELSDKIRTRIINGRFKKLAKSTIKRKGHDTKLIESGDMYDAIRVRRLK